MYTLYDISEVDDSAMVMTVVMMMIMMIVIVMRMSMVVLRCLITSSHKSNFHANHAHHTHHAQNWSVEPLSDFRLDPPLHSTIYNFYKNICLIVR